jgi:hypothetical protein
MLLLNALLLLGVVAAVYWRFTQPVWGSSSAPADLFMQSVSTEDGGLGWSQLCPGLQTQLPLDVLDQQTLMQRSLQTQQRVTLTIQHIGDTPRPTGGEIRFYVATAHGSDGSTGQKTYVVKTQTSGCVESVQ